MGDLENVNQAKELKKPKSFFERMLMHTRNMTHSDKEISNSHRERSERSENGKTEVQQDEEIAVAPENMQVISEKTVNEIIEIIINRTLGLSGRLDKLKLLVQRCAEDESLFDDLLSESLLKFCADLLNLYCDPHSKDDEELNILVPLLSLISNCDESNLLFSRHSNFTYNLMRACAVCVTGLLSKTEELLKITRKRKLAARKGRIRGGDSIKILARGLGIPCFLTDGFLASYFGDCQIESFRLSLFDTSVGVTDTDINQYIANMHVSHLPEQNCGSDLENVSSNSSFSQMASDDGKEEWTDVVVAHALPFGDIIAYLKADWEHCLSVINGDLVEFLRQKGNITHPGQKNNSVIRIGSIVGFWTKDARFKWKPLTMMQCLRGLILGRASQTLVGGESLSWAIWAIDVGTLVFCNKVWPLEPLTSVAPLTSMCSLGREKAVKDKEENRFLLVSLPFLAKLLANKPSVAIHMLSFGNGNHPLAHNNFNGDEITGCDGGAFLKLIEYPHTATRIAYLNLILMLIRNSMEILRYLQECRFNMALYSRLQICVHFCSSVFADSSFWMELRLLLRILTAMADGSNVDITETPGWSDLHEVLIMLTEIENHPQVRYMAAKCIASFKSHRITTKSRNSRNPGLSDEKPKKNVGVQKSSDAKAGSSKSTRKSSKGTSRWMDIEFKSRETVLSQPDDSKPVLSVMDVVDYMSSEEDIESLPPVNAVYDAVKAVDYYTKGYKVNIFNDETRELSLEKTPHQILESNLSKVVCAFLNNGIGGSVYFGIDSSSVIDGIRMSRIERDNFRKGIDRMMTRSIFPEIRPACYDINYVPVLNPGEKSKALASHKVWVVEVHVKALPHLVYCLVSDHKSYIRRGTDIIEGLGLYMRQEAAEQNRKDVIKAIEDVKAQIPQTEEKLISYIQDYLKRTQSQGCVTDVKFTSTFSP